MFVYQQNYQLRTRSFLLLILLFIVDNSKFTLATKKAFKLKIKFIKHSTILKDPHILYINQWFLGRHSHKSNWSFHQIIMFQWILNDKYNFDQKYLIFTQVINIEALIQQFYIEYELVCGNITYLKELFHRKVLLINLYEYSI